MYVPMNVLVLLDFFTYLHIYLIYFSNLFHIFFSSYLLNEYVDRVLPPPLPKCRLLSNKM